ncbi:nicotinate-nucleotide adenylyltransferase [Tropicimonas sp. TH_r6]|uniref:nicotinate-nucleotide adenylyltransferase n=1 Tax=Tropicimonas sp. TH_r6 TaxID=3082085 RepID=UPI0029533AA0|nr:nicotinate-nucleotide adenylyltransferase [Tropicimonas sp. TH_r6]MDV7142029.1 nicotinate-nucleotide adenylyltransferase [Tropicimonas sp. TH_r6]
MRDMLPHARPGQTIGLLGGSFDPPHAGHVHVTREALKRFGLDRVWWLVSPGNPLKPHGPAPLSRRMAAARGVMAHPKVEVTDIEARIGTRYTAETLQALQALYPSCRFVWLMGADNMAQFHLWDRWDWILRHVPIGILARPGDRMAALNSPAARLAAPWRLPARNSAALARAEAPCWCFINVPMRDISSSEIRARGDWG